MSYRIHFLALASAVISANLSFAEDFGVVAGQTAEGELVLPTSPDPSYIVPGGLLGLPYYPELGHVGARLDFNFPKAVTGIIIVTASFAAPIPVAAYTAPTPPPPPAIVYPTVSFSTLQNVEGPFEGLYNFVFAVTWTEISDYTSNVLLLRRGSPNAAGAPRPEIGKTLPQLLAAGYVIPE